MRPDEAAVYCDSEVSSAENTALLDRLITDGAAVTIDGAPFTLTGQVQSVSVVTDRSITISFALIVPDAAFDRYTQGDYDVYLNAVLAPSATEGKSLMRAIADHERSSLTRSGWNMRATCKTSAGSCFTSSRQAT